MLVELKTANRKSPLFNESPYLSTISPAQTHPSSYADLDWWIERSPELIRIVSSIVEDILGDGVFFTGKTDPVKRATQFWEQNFSEEELRKVLFDWALYGDGYLWKGRLNNHQREEVRMKSLEAINPRFRHYEWKVRDEDRISTVRHAPTTTMDIRLNPERTEILKFTQRVHGLTEREYSPKDIIHTKYWTVRGKVYGFSPAMALISELAGIAYIKDYAKSWFKEGGWPDFIFNFENEQPSSTRVKDLIQKLQKYKHPIEKHGNLVTTGTMNAIELNKFSKDMEFRQLIIQLTGIAAFAYGLPAGRISSIIGAEVKVSTGSDDLSNESYWNMIAGHKNRLEILLNSQLFSEFGDVKIQLPRGHKVDAVRKTQALMQQADYLSKLQSLGVKFNMHYVKDTLGIKDEHLDSQKLEPPQPAITNPTNRQGQANQRELADPGSQAVGRMRKKQEKAASDKGDIGV